MSFFAACLKLPYRTHFPPYTTPKSLPIKCRNLPIDSCLGRIPAIRSGNKEIHRGVSKNRGTSKSYILIGLSLINHPFWGRPIFGNTHISIGMIYLPRLDPLFGCQISGSTVCCFWCFFLGGSNLRPFRRIQVPTFG